ncbi:NAD(+) diphosphatase [Sporichthya polymorpha]|uniref:NAD(+) diphosphatase n=1 Tax=Sporichthya polymorpha TaxID=35751 RepID=UPI000366BB7C|nr:NAD(+) diphosphatase [Sporichthya polymorpha]
MNELRLSRATHDRSAHLRLDPKALDAAWSDPRARVLVVRDSASLLLADGSDLVYLTSSQLEDVAPDGRFFLGFDDAGVPYFAVDRELVANGEEQRVTHLREISSRLSAAASGLFVHAVGLANWHARHQFCPNCGARTESTAAGHVRRCPDCGMQQFPRSDPAVIMLVVDDDDRALLGRAPVWPEGRFSTLAGFVEPGESLEQAVRREVLEEVGVVVDEVTYQASQPWPFPSSLMLGFHARASSTDITLDPEEIAEARWLSRGELLEAGRRGEILMPGSISIARWLIERWYGEPLPKSNSWGGSRT